MNWWVSASTGNLYVGDCIPGDVAATDAQVAAWQAANVPLVTVPAWQAKAVLHQTSFSSTGLPANVATATGSAANLLDAATNLVNASGNSVLMAYWNYATTFTNTDATLQSLGAQLGLTSDQINALFAAAATITI